jgi:hypothetical protein
LKRLPLGSSVEKIARAVYDLRTTLAQSLPGCISVLLFDKLTPLWHHRQTLNDGTVLHPIAG